MSALPLRRASTTPMSLALDLGHYFRTPKGSLTLVLLVLFELALSRAGWRLTVPHVLAAVAGACAVELAAVRLRLGRLRWPTSALLSGLILAFVLGPETPWSVTLGLGALTTVSKRLLRSRHGHVFNPAALALAVSAPLFATGQSWWGALPDLPAAWIVVLLVGGAFIVERVNKWPLVLAFGTVYFGVFTLVAQRDPATVAEMFRAPFVHAAVFFAAFMLTDPPTSPGGTAEQVWFGGLVAAVATAAQVSGAGQTYLLLGLLAGNVALAVHRATVRAATRRAAPAATELPRGTDEARERV